MRRITRFGIFKRDTTSYKYIIQQAQSIRAMPRLHTLVLDHSYFGPKDHSGLASGSLVVLRTYGVGIDWGSCSLPNLRTIATSETYTWSLGQCHKFSSALFTMSSITFISITTRGDHDFTIGDLEAPVLQRITLPHLTSLQICGMPMDIFDSFLGFIDAPHLRSLSLVGHFIGFTNVYGDGFESNWEQCLLKCPELESLTLRFLASPTTLLRKITSSAASPALQVDIVIVKDALAEVELLEAEPTSSSNNPIICNRYANCAWDCEHPDCKELTQNTIGCFDIVRWRSGALTGE